jgi:hypothetical protein
VLPVERTALFWHTSAAKSFGHRLKCHSFTGACRPCNQAVAVGHLGKKKSCCSALAISKGSDIRLESLNRIPVPH